PGPSVSRPAWRCWLWPACAAAMMTPPTWRSSPSGIPRPPCPMIRCSPRSPSRMPLNRAGRPSDGGRRGSWASTSEASGSRSSLVDRHHLTLLHTVVGRQRADEGVVLILFDDVGGPPGQAGQDEQRGEEIHRETEDVIGRACREIQVGFDAGAVLHHLLHLLVHAHPLLRIVTLRQGPQGLLHRRHPAVTTLVHAVAEAHDQVLVVQG